MPGHETNTEPTDPVQHGPTSATEARAIVALDERECPQCGYPLKGLPTNTCPECGYQATDEELALGVRRAIFMELSRFTQAANPLVCVGLLLFLLGWINGFCRDLLGLLVLGVLSMGWWFIRVPASVGMFPRSYRWLALRLWFSTMAVMQAPWVVPLIVLVIASLAPNNTVYLSGGRWRSELTTPGWALLMVLMGASTALVPLLWRLRWTRIATIAGMPSRWRDPAVVWPVVWDYLRIPIGTVCALTAIILFSWLSDRFGIG